MIPLDRHLRILGVEGGSFDAFNRNASGHTLLCGVIMEGDTIIEVRHEKIKIDGFDATCKLLSLMRGVKVDVVILGGITIGGFNVIDPWVIFNEIRLPVIVYSGKRPNNDAVLAALRKHFTDWEKRWKIIRGVGEIQSTISSSKNQKMFFEAVGCDLGWAEEVLKSSALISRIPEPVRVAGLVARGLTRVCESQ